MVYRLHSGVTGNKIQKLKQKSINLTMAFVLAFTGLGATPLLWEQTASAVSNTNYTDVSLSGWTPDRTTPSGGYSEKSFEGRQTLELNVVAPPSVPSSFYQYEGVKKTIANSTTVAADLFIDPSWPSNAHVGFWGIGYDGGSSPVSYPIVQYQESDNSWRVWNNPGGWTPITVSSVVAGWNTIELALDKNDSTKTGIYINGVLAGYSIHSTTTVLKGIILNNYNTGADNYSVHWSNIKAGQYLPDVLENIQLYNGGSAVASGTSTNNPSAALKWNTTADADRYQVRITKPDGNTTGQFTQTTPLQLLVSRNYFGTQEGTYSYEVRVKSATTGLWSPWSAAIQLNYDITRSTIEVLNPLTDYEVLSDSDSIEVKTTDNIALKKVTANIYTSTGTLIDPNSTSTSATEYTMSIPLTGLADGDYYVKTNSQDAAGNPLAHTITRYFTIDSTGPVIGDTSTGVISMYTGDKITLDPEATDSHGPVTYSWSVSDKLLLNDPKESLDGETLRVGPTKKGSYEAVVVATDAIGNTSTKIYEITVLTPAVAEQSNQNPQTLGATTGGGSSNSNSNSRTSNGNGNNETIVVATAVNQAAETGEVKGATTSTANLTAASNDDTVKNSNFMGLGWWWLPLLALLFGFFFIALGRRSDQK